MRFGFESTRPALAVAALLTVLVSTGTAQIDDIFEDELVESALLEEVQDDEAVADDELLFGESEATGGGTSWIRDWKGFVEIQPRVYFEDRAGPKNDGQLLVRGEVELDLQLADGLTGYFRPRFFVDALDEELHRYEPFEAYVTFEGDDWDLRAGQFVENWGIVDTFNPIDVINRRDLGSDILDADRLGELGVRYRRTFAGTDSIGEPTLSFYALPIFRHTLFGTADQRVGPETAQLRFDEDGGFEPSGDEEGLYAVRFQSTVDTELANADIQFLASRGPSRTPLFFVDPTGTLVPAYFGATTIGAGFRAVPNEDAVGEWLAGLTLKTEIVFTDAFDFSGSPVPAPDDYVAAIFGVDRSFYDLFSDQDELVMTLEYAREEGANDAAALLRPFRDDLIVRGLYEVNDFARQSLEVRGLFDLDVDETILELIYERQVRSIHEDLKLTIGVQIFEAARPGKSFFSLLADPSSLSVGLRWDL